MESSKDVQIDPNVEKEPLPDTKQEPIDEGESITSYVKQEISSQLIEMGFSKNVSEKACFFSQNNLEKAIEWIGEHQADPDLEEELRIVGKKDAPKMTDEEIKRKAKELQEYARKRYIQKQKELEEEQEKNRVRITKEMTKAKKELEEAEMRRYLEIKKNEKKEAELEKKRMLEQLARDKEERFGKKFDPYTQSTTGKKEFTPLEDAQYYLKAIKTAYPPFRAGETLRLCYETLKVILRNIVQNPNEEKFRKIRATNPNFEERVGKIKIALKLLESIGFVLSGEFYTVASPDIQLYSKIVEYLDEELKKLE